MITHFSFLVFCGGIAAAFLAGVTGVSILFGFGTTLAAAKKKDPNFFDQGLTGRIEKQTTKPISSQTTAAVRRRVPVSISSVEPGASLAIRALGWGTLYAVTGCSVLFYGIWKLMAVNDVSTISYDLLEPRMKTNKQHTNKPHIWHRRVFCQVSTANGFMI